MSKLVPAHGGGVTAAAFHPSQPILFTAGGDGLVKAWNLPIDPKQPKKDDKKAPKDRKDSTLKAEIHDVDGYFGSGVLLHGCGHAPVLLRPGA